MGTFCISPIVLFVVAPAIFALAMGLGIFIGTRIRRVIHSKKLAGNDLLFDPTSVPVAVVSAKGVHHVNDIVRRLEARRVDRIRLPEPESGFRVSNMIRTYNQAHLRRCLMFLRAARKLVYGGDGLVALTAVRCIYETVANFLDFEAKLQLEVAQGDLRKIHDFVHNRAFSTKLPNLIKEAGTPAVQAMSVLTQIDKMKAVRGSARDDYDYLCEHTHPNSFGGVLYFANPGSADDIVTFTDLGPDPADDLKWVLVAGHILGYFEQALDRIEAQLPALSEKSAEQLRANAK
jgi:hypothetical protein